MRSKKDPLNVTALSVRVQAIPEARVPDAAEDPPTRSRSPAWAFVSVIVALAMLVLVGSVIVRVEPAAATGPASSTKVVTALVTLTVPLIPSPPMPGRLLITSVFVPMMKSAAASVPVNVIGSRAEELFVRVPQNWMPLSRMRTCTRGKPKLLP